MNSDTHLSAHKNFMRKAWYAHSIVAGDSNRPVAMT